MPNGVYVSVTIQDPTTRWLFSTGRDTWAECRADLEDMFGEEFIQQLTQVLPSKPSLSVVIGGQPEEVLPVKEVAKGLGAQLPEESESLEATAEATFDTCSCGYLINRLVPAGVSKRTGKRYAAFLVCSNPDRNHKGETRPVE
jgi:hypothetical protein